MRLSDWTCVGVVGLCATILLAACGDDDGVAAVDAGDSEQDSGGVRCVQDDQCNDGVFCNGIERCLPNHADANAEGCLVGTPPRCDDGLACTVDSCSHAVNGCRFVPIDADGDGHAAADCVTREGESLGDDCDDNDANRFPGNAETCTEATEDHDEDCDPLTFGWRDVDADGEVDAVCCNGERCGSDCDDGNRRSGSNHPEICDEIDNDCDLRVDEDAVDRPWYPDLDGDGFGDNDGVPEESCAPVPERSLFNTDCADTLAAINPAALELCDDVDNDCDGETDENDVCSCGVPGAQPCECSAGAVDCLGGLIPRECVGGRWATRAACGGVTPICAFGRCVCVNGGTACSAVVDTSAPFVIATAPGEDATGVSTAIVVAVVLSEPPSPIDDQEFRLLDSHGVAVASDHTIDGHLVSLTPRRALLPGHIYTVVLENVSDRAGNVMPTSQSWRFATAVADYDRTPIVTDPLRDYGNEEPILVSGEGGHVAVSARSDVLGDTMLARSEVFRFSDTGTWVPTGWLSPASTPPQIGLAADGTLVGATIGRAPAVYSLPVGSTGWGSEEIFTSLLTERALAVVGNRYVVVRADLNNTVVATGQVGTSPTNLAASVPPLPTGMVRFDVATNATGDVALIAARTTDLTLAYWNGVQWRTRSFVADTPTEPSVRVTADGRAIATWVQRTPRMMGATPITITIQHVARFDAAAIADPVAMGGNDSHVLPVVAWLSDGSALLVRSANDVTANRMDADGVLGPTVNLEARIAGNRTGAIDLAAMPNGDAVVIWPQRNATPFSETVIVAARYVAGEWQAIEVLVDDVNNPFSANVEAMSDGRALMVWNDSRRTGHSLILPASE